MSVSEDNQSLSNHSQSYDDEMSQMSGGGGYFENNRGDHYSEDSSPYYASSNVDPSTRNKCVVMRYNPEKKRNVPVKFFPTKSTPNSIIKNALNGAFQTPFRVGSRDEDLFFSVLLATGELGQEAPLLFYDSPEQYEQHFFTKISVDAKDAWRQKRDSALLSYNQRQARRSSVNVGGIIVK